MPVINATQSIILDTFNACYYGSALSIFAGLFVVYTYVACPALRVQPNSILVAKSVFDMLLGIMIVVEYVPVVNVTRESDYSQPLDCGGDFVGPSGNVTHSNHGWVATFLTQWFFSMSLLCFGIISLDLVINSTNPFANMRKNNMRYAVGVFLVSLIPPTVMTVEINGKTGSGRWILGFCFTKWSYVTRSENTTQHLEDYNWRIWALDISVIAVMLLFSVFVAIFFCRQNQLKAKTRGKLYGEEQRFTNEVLSTTMNCVMAFLFFWLINAGLYMALFIDVQSNPQQLYDQSPYSHTATIIASVFAFVFSAQGFVLLPFWFRGSCLAKEGTSSRNILAIRQQLFNALSCRCRQNFEKKEKSYDVLPTTNSALRKEIVTYLSNGIQLLKDVNSEHAEIAPTYAKIRLLITIVDDDDDDASARAPASTPTGSPETTKTANVTQLTTAPAATQPTTALTDVTPASNGDSGVALADSDAVSPFAAAMSQELQLAAARAHGDSTYHPDVSADALAASAHTATRHSGAPAATEILASTTASPTTTLTGASAAAPAPTVAREADALDAADIELGVSQRATPSPSVLSSGRTAASRRRRFNNDHVRIISLNSKKQGGCVMSEMWPREMAKVREAMFEDPSVYHESLSSISAAKLSGGKSDAFMFKTDDKRFVLKTMSSGEFKQLERMMMVPRHGNKDDTVAADFAIPSTDHSLNSSASSGKAPLILNGKGRSSRRGKEPKVPFWEYMIENKSSFIVKIFGVYKMTLSVPGSFSDGVKQYFIVMQNVFYDADTSKQQDLIQETYDLKGSTVARSAQPLKPGTHAICRYCRLEFVVGEKNVATPQPGDFVQLTKDYEQNDGGDTFDVRTGILQRRFPDGMWRVKWASTQTPLPKVNGAEAPDTAKPTYSVHAAEELCWCDGKKIQVSKETSAKCKVNRRHEPVQVFKDNDLKYKIVVAPSKKFEVGKQLRMDSAFLARHGVMDYSLLLGVHRSQFLNTRTSKWPVTVVRMPEPAVTKQLYDLFVEGHGAQAVSNSTRSMTPEYIRSTPMFGVGKSRANTASKDHAHGVSPASSPHSHEDGGVTRHSGGSSLTSMTADSWAPRAKLPHKMSQSGIVTSINVGVLDGRASAQLMEGPTKYYFGIIDILQRWNQKKRTERYCKKLLCCAVGQALSATEPVAYKHRFDRFMNEQVFDTANSKANVILQSVDQVYSWVIEVPASVVHAPAAVCIDQVRRFAVQLAAKECGVDPKRVQLDNDNMSACVLSLSTGGFLNEIPIVSFSCTSVETKE